MALIAGLLLITGAARTDVVRLILLVVLGVALLTAVTAILFGLLFSDSLG